VPALRGLYLVTGVLVGVLLPFVPVILSQRGFSAAQIGILMALTAVGYVVGMPLWGHLGDVVLGRRRSLQVAALASSAAALLFGAPLILPLVAAAVVAYYLVESGAGMLTDAIAVNALVAHPEQFGRVRLVASASFAVATLAAGAAYDVVGYGLAYALAAVAGVILALVCYRVPDAPRARLADYRRERSQDVGTADAAPRRAVRWRDATGSIGVAVAVEPRLIGVMAAVVLVHLGVLASFTFLPLRLAELGGDPSVIALSSTVSALFEIPAMFVAARMASRIGMRGLFAGACGLYAAAFVSWVVLADPLLIVGSRVLTGLAYGSLTVAVVLTVGAMLPQRLQASGQALFGMSASGIASVGGNLGGGILFGAYGHGAVFACGAAGAVAAAVVAWRFLPARGEVRVGAARR
jgi:MFS transporter, PPP family, 3-phenylpropionic acid transporter